MTSKGLLLICVAASCMCLGQAAVQSVSRASFLRVIQESRHLANTHDKLTNKQAVIDMQQLFEDTGCSCAGYSCECCVDLDLYIIKEKGCVNITFVPEDLSLEFTLSVNDKIIIDQYISVSNPPPICAAIPYLEDYNASICVEFHDLSITDSSLTGCVGLEVLWEGSKLFDVDLGCFTIPPTEPISDADLKLRKIRYAVVQEKRQKRFQTVQDLFYQDNKACDCVGYDCGCCLHLEVSSIGLNQTGCLNISYLPDELGIELTLSFNGVVVVDEKVSVKNPPPICAGIPYLEEYASACIVFRDLDVVNSTFTGCVDIEIQFEGFVVKDFDLGCFQIPPSVRRRIPAYIFV